MQSRCACATTAPMPRTSRIRSGALLSTSGELVAEMLDDSARERGTDAFYFRSEVAFERDRSGGPHGFEIETRNCSP